jgi:hypothetical protein
VTARKSYADLDPIVIYQIGQSEYSQVYLAWKFKLGVNTIAQIQRDQRALHRQDHRFSHKARIRIVVGMSEDQQFRQSRPHSQRPADHPQSLTQIAVPRPKLYTDN